MRLSSIQILAFIVVSLTILSTVGCSAQPYREFNSEDTQDPACYAKYGGIRGYCDAVGSED